MTSDEKEIKENPSESITETEGEVTGQESSQEQILKGFVKLSEQEERPYRLIQYIDDNIGLVNEETAEKMFELLEKSQKSYSNTYMDLLFEDDFQQDLSQVYTYEATGEVLEEIKDDNLKDLLNEIFDGGYKLINLEGSFYPFIDYGLFERYYQYVSQEFVDYYKIMAVESNNIYSKDAGLTISWKELGTRLTDSESYLINYPAESRRKVEVSKLYMNYLSAYLYGLNNTPSRDYETGKVHDELILSYREILDEYPDTVSGAIVKDYLGLLEGTEYILTDDLLSEIKQYFKKPIIEYGLDSYFMLVEQVKNLNYPSEFSQNGYIKLSDGHYSEKYDQESATGLIIDLTDNISIGDLDGDQINDVAVILVSDPGGSGTFYNLHVIINGYFFIYSISDDFLGDRVKIERLSIDGEKIFIDMVTHKEDDPLCCPTDEVSRAYIIEDGMLIKLIIHTGIIETITDQYIDMILDDGAILEIMLEGYDIPSGITEGSKIYVEYYADYHAEQNIIYYIDNMQ